ncbi:MAG: NTP transferase domain-containing protein [Holosporaceae bacterium]|jgi:bifunctional UDP-N-acetylglucosamine pyrophosphorylase/glucosamine-1-phosphate N-acetyltransferase|nr:NTP transferase domain-containing protein [Holosporaceae bacterium]
MERTDNSVVILAAGVGSRFLSNIPKVFHKIGGLSMLDHVIRTAKETKSSRIVAILSPKYKDANLAFTSDIKKAYQDIPRGTADAVKCGLKLLPEDSEGWVYVLYGDIPLISSETLQKLSLISRECSKTAVVILAMDSNGTNDLGKLEIDEHGRVKSIIEAKDISDSNRIIPLCNAGLFIKKDILKQFIEKIKPNSLTGEFYITKIVQLAYEAGYVCRYHKGDQKELLGVNTKSELATLEKIFQERERQKHMKNGVTLIAPETVFFSYDTHIENDVVIYPYVVFGENVCIKSGAQVGPFAHLRAGTNIQNEVRIGNFVEIKNSVISEKSKVNHLSYIGDAYLGKNTNIGAGTITCNYDGFRKHKTVIGENVFVGSNTALVAPVEIQDDVVIGAGSVIVKDVASGSLAIARSDQKNIANRAINLRKMKKCAGS